MLHGQFVRQTKEMENQDRWQWLRNGTLTRETESLIFTAKDIVKGKFDKSQEQTKCRICRRADEITNHIVRECPKLAQLECKRGHDWIGRRIHLGICGANGIHVKPKWREHQSEAVIENDLCKILQADHFIATRRPQVIVIDKEHHECQIIDFDTP